MSKFKAKFLKHIISPMNTLNILLWSNHLAYAVTHLLNISTKLTKELNPRFLVGFVLINQSLFVQCFIDHYFCLLDLVFWPCILSSNSNYVFWLSHMASSNFFKFLVLNLMSISEHHRWIINRYVYIVFNLNSGLSGM